MVNYKRIITGIILLLAIYFIYGCKQKTETDNTAKYVFYFIGDGMGIQQVNATQAYLAALDEKIGNKHLSFTEFPVTGFSTTYSSTRYITGSAAAGTAMATGEKTSINTLGLNADRTDSLFSIAFHAHKEGFQVGVTTSVSIDHATPAAFYAHQPVRDMYYEIAHDLINSGFRFFGGGGFIDPSGKKSANPSGNIFDIGKEKGIFFTQDLSIPDSIRKKYETIVYTSPNPAEGSALHYYIDRDDTDVSLTDITSLAIDILHNPKGFFLMVEGGKIDWACHHNDAATTINEMICFSNAIDVAIEFYKQYPNETLIVVTSDHETGGMSFGNRQLGYESNIALLTNQKESFEEFNSRVINFKAQYNSKPTFSKVIDFIKSELQIANEKVELTELQKFNLDRAYKASLREHEPTQIDKITESDEYGTFDPLTVAAIQILNQKAGIGWTSFSHTGSQVPVYALGVGQELFCGLMDNTDIPKRIAKIMGISMD